MRHQDLPPPTKGKELMEIDTKEVMDGKRNGDVVWICHYLRPDLNKKPLRSVPPTKVRICSIDELPKSRKVYYSKSFFAPVGRMGNTLSKVISPVDNTGYRGYCGNMLHVFSTVGECRAKWRAETNECCERIEALLETVVDNWQVECAKVKALGNSKGLKEEDCK
jgi:hypothetical protein